MTSTLFHLKEYVNHKYIVSEPKQQLYKISTLYHVNKVEIKNSKNIMEDTAHHNSHLLLNARFIEYDPDLSYAEHLREVSE